MNLKHIAIITLMAAALSACGEDNKADTTVSLDDANTIALVDGHAITLAERAQHMEQRQRQGQASDAETATDELINLKVITINAQKAGIHEREDVQAELQRQRDGYLANVYIQEQMEAIEVSDADIQAEFDRQNSIYGVFWNLRLDI